VRVRSVVAILAALAALGLGLISARWLPPVLAFADANSDLIQGLTGIADLLWYAVSAMCLIFAWLGLRKKGEDAGAERSSSAFGERSASIAGDVSGPVVTGDHNQLQVTYGDQVTVQADEESFRRYLNAKAGISTGPPPEPQMFVGREHELSELKARLLGTNVSTEESATVVTGLPGMGKTAFVTVATSDDAVQRAFPGGTAWVFLGPSADVVEELGRLARHFGAVVDGGTQDLAEAQARLASLLPEERTLLVVDDAFSALDAAAFRVADSRATVLFTTRDREVARQLSPGRPGPLVLKELSEVDALELLTRLAPNTVALHRSGAEELVRELGGMPLAIRVAGRLLAAEERLGWGVESLLTELREGRRVLENEAPADRLPVPEGASPTVAALLQTSLERLPAEVVDRFRVLGVFPSKPISFELAAAASVWAADEEDARSTIRGLEGRGLLEPAGSGRFYLHPILSSYARLRLETDTDGTSLSRAQLRHAQHYRQVLLDAEDSYRRGGQDTQRAFEIFEEEQAQIKAGRLWAESHRGDDTEAAELCARYGVCAPDLIVKMLKPSERRLWLESAVAAAESLGDEALLLRAESHLVTTYTRTAENAHAMEILERHLVRARAENNKNDEMVALGNLAVAYDYEHEYAQAEECYRQVAQIARDLKDERSEARALQDLALSLDSRGEHRPAAQMLRDVLGRARKAKDKELEAGVLHRLASNQGHSGHFSRAAVFARASLGIYEELRNIRDQAFVLNTLGTFSAERGEADEARRCFLRALDLADEWEQLDLQAVASGNLGDVAKNLEGDPDKALSLYKEQIRLARLVGLKGEEGRGNWNTARILRRRPGNTQAALEHAQEASRLFGETGDPHREQVWSLIREIAQAQ
jgi:tetratricopeptide (TPR) repeat protein